MIDRAYLEITNICNLRCDFCPKTERQKRQLTYTEFDQLTDKLVGRVKFLYFHLMGEPMLHPQLAEFVRLGKLKGFATVLTSNGTLIHRAPELLDSLPYKIQLSLHSHEGNGGESPASYIEQVMRFSIEAAHRGTIIVLRLWNQGGQDTINPLMLQLLEQYVPQPWHQRPDGYRLCENLYLEFDRRFEWPDASSSTPVTEQEVFCQALIKQIGILVDGSLVPCCLDHDGSATLGNLFEQTLDEILNSTRSQAMLDGFAHHRATEALCQHCESAAVQRSFRGK